MVAIFHVKEDGALVDALLGDVQRYARQLKAGKSGHWATTGGLSGARLRRHRSVGTLPKIGLARA